MSGRDWIVLPKRKPFFSLRRNKMADSVYMPDPWSALAAQHSDIRREGSVERGDIRYDVATRAGDIRRETAEGISEVRYDVATRSADNRYANAIGQGEIKYAIAEHAENTNRDILVTGANTAVKVDEAADKIQQRAADFYIAGQARDFDNSRDLAALKAVTDLTAQKLSTEILLSAERGATATALESAKVAAAVALGQSQLSKEIAESKYDMSKQVAYENEKTRDLINSLKNDELNRMLIERNTDLTHCRHDYWGARDGLFNSQFAALSSQLNSQVNALNSQLTETRQGLVNFGSMNGNAGQQSSTSNNVR
jgi:hypothetical protein